MCQLLVNKIQGIARYFKLSENLLLAKKHFILYVVIDVLF